MIAIPNMEKPKECIEEWEFGLMGNPCKFLESDMSCLIQPESEPFDCGENYEHCPLIEIVTCGECKWFIEQGEGNVGKCKYRTRPILYCLPTDFCSYGERRTDEHNT